MPGKVIPHRPHSIHEAVKQSDVLSLEFMTKNGGSINEVEDVDKFTPLHTACNNGALECVHWLLWHGADPNITTPKGWTAAHIAAIRGQDGCLQALTNSGVSLAEKDVRGCTPTHLAASHGHAFSLNAILRSGVDVNAVDRNGWMPIHYAAYHGRLGCLQTLIKWGANPDEVENNGNTPAHLAAQEGHLPCLKYLVTYTRNQTHTLGARNDNGEMPKDLAEQFYKQNILDYINNIEWEEEHPEVEDNSAFPAHVAAYAGDLDQLKTLVENGVVNINEKDTKGSTPAHKAAGQGHLRVLQWLVEMGSDMTIENSAGETPRDVALRFSHLACVKILGGDPDADEIDEDDDLDLDEDDDDVDDDDDSFDGASGRRGGRHAKAKRRAARREKGLSKEVKSRACTRIEELEKQLEIAKKNFVQLGGVVPEYRKERIELQSKNHTIRELESQLDYERLKREKLEADLDAYRKELAFLTSQLDSRLGHSDGEDTRYPRGRSAKRRTSKSKNKKPQSDDRNLLKRNYVPKKN
ncbi:hypothetical protein SNE40_000176 [Patella caerulea]|uniref:Ankyrin repeat domain-containing protein 42 n=1 Tax=Patella caerulea TaxID=87958 RepID=A0AAN8Q193_PATCE